MLDIKLTSGGRDRFIPVRKGNILGALIGVDLDFEAVDAVAKLEHLGLLKRQGERLLATPFDDAFANLHGLWDKLFPAA